MKNRTFFYIGWMMLLAWFANPVKAQSVYGSTGLLRMPTADMQKDKTFMLGANMIDVHTLSRYWSPGLYTPYTYNYYINITLFPWLEVAYTCTLVKGAYGSSYWPQQTWGKFVNQDREFTGRIRLWKEGWWKEWTPQVVLGAVDLGNHESYGGGEIQLGGGNTSHLTTFYLAATKHIRFNTIGEAGIHVAMVNRRWQNTYDYIRPALGANFRFSLPETSFWRKAVNGVNLMAEYDSRVFNCGLQYSVWKDRINAVVELNDGRYVNAGLYFKICLK